MISICLSNPLDLFQLGDNLVQMLGVSYEKTKIADGAAAFYSLAAGSVFGIVSSRQIDSFTIGSSIDNHYRIDH